MLVSGRGNGASTLKRGKSSGGRLDREPSKLLLNDRVKAPVREAATTPARIFSFCAVPRGAGSMDTMQASKADDKTGTYMFPLGNNTGKKETGEH